LARKILLADDSVTAQNMGRKILADAGYEVVTVNNGSAALKRVAETKPDLIVLDVYMPGYSGLEVCQRLKEVSETARIPILLTVGKLEPFKPEEAKRARADAFIVKPFEASELLSALAKLEDKIVPRPEPSKPGRFARAIAAVEEGRYDKSVAIEEDSGWKERISFPSKKKSRAPEPEEVDDPAIYNPVNKDLRTVVEHAPEHKPHTAKAEDSRVDMAALAPQGWPKDVTPEEIAALAAAAAQIKGTTRGHESTEDKHTEQAKDGAIPAAAEPTPQPPVTAHAEVPEVKREEKTEAKEEQPAPSIPKETPAVAPVVEAVAEHKEPEAKAEASADKRGAEKESLSAASPAAAELTPASVKPEPVPHAAAEASSEAGSGNGTGSYPADEPVTMAAAAGAAFSSADSRWMAVPVGLLPEEAAISLEDEMNKSHAASAVTETTSAVPREAIAEPQPAPMVSSPVEPPPVEAAAAEPRPVEPPAAEPPVPAPAVVPEVAETVSAVTTDAEAIQAVVKEFESVAAAMAEAHPPTSVEPEPVPAPEPVTQRVVESPQVVESKLAEPPVIEHAAAEPEPASPQGVSASASSELEKEAEPEEKKAEPEPDKQPVVEAVAVAPANLTPSAEESEVAVPVQEREVPAEPSGVQQAWHVAKAADKPASGGTEDMASKKEKEIAATTAAAWATWRRVRESKDSKAEPSSQEKDEAAMAVAAGAEKAPEEAPAASQDSGEIASIVDSVLADLRPKIVEEISKKLGKKKK
jgi:CheY-like chemotaxis protein